jgi:threonine dehydrogenase-like Zn-dependent dehydrogenase
MEELTVIQRLGVAYGAMSNVDIKAGETVIVGPATGLLPASSAVQRSKLRLLSARVMALGRNEETLAKLKATIPRVETVVITGDVEKDAKAIQVFGLADAFVDFSPHTLHSEPSHIRSAIESLRKRGRIALMGDLGGTVALPYFLMILNSLELKGKWMYTRPEIRNLVKMVETGTLKIGKAAGHQVNGRFKLEDYEAAFETAAKHTGWGTHVVYTP